MNNFSVNDSVLRSFCEDVTKKNVLAVHEPTLIPEFLTYIQLHNDYMKTANAYEIASTIRSFETWYLNKDKEPNHNHPVTYRDVYYVDLGAFNLKYESGFIHPCIVIRKYGCNMLVIPCSSKKYGKNDELIFDIGKGDVFRENTGALLDQVRNVSVTRLKGKMGRVDAELFNDLIDQLMKKYLCKKYSDFKVLENKNKKLDEQINDKDKKICELEEIINTKDKEISNLQNELEELKQKIIVSK